MSTAFRLEVLPSNVAVLTLDTPGTKVNVLATPVMAELESQMKELAKRTDLRGVVITSGKEDTFIAGANLEEIVTIQSDPLKTYHATQEGKRVFQLIQALPFPSVALVNGVCLGGGMELVLHCTYRVATRSKKTKFGLPEVGLGFLPGWGGCVLLTKMIGAEAALKFITDPLRKHDAYKAWQQGIVDEVVDEKTALDRAVEIVLGAKPKRASQSMKAGVQRWFIDKTSVGRNMFAKGAKAAMRRPTRNGEIPAPAAVLKVILAALTKPAKVAFELESRLFSDLAKTLVSKNLVGLYFADQASRKAPNAAAPKINIGSIGVAGAGAMGSEIAYVSLLAGFTVILYDKFEAGLEKGYAKIHDLIMEQVKKGKYSGDTADNFLTSLAKTTDIAGFKNCDIVIEAIKEDMGLKKTLLADIERVKEGKPFVYATNTSSLSVTEMMADAVNPGDHCGLHFFNPVSKMPLVEVIAGAKTSPETIASVMAYCQRLSGKVTVTSGDKAGFIVNRDLVPYARESVKLLEAGVPAQDIEDAMKAFGMRMGPLELMDKVGLDIAGKVMHVLNEAFGDRMSPPAILSFIEEKKLLGEKGGKGIYIWTDGKRGEINPELAAVLGVQKKIKMDRGAIQERLVLVMINEAARLLEEGVVSEPWQVDLAMIMGTGFPPDRGGVLRYADSLGLANVVQKLTWLSQVAGENFKPAQLLVDKARKGEKFYA